MVWLSCSRVPVLWKKGCTTWITQPLQVIIIWIELHTLGLLPSFWWASLSSRSLHYDQHSFLQNHQLHLLPFWQYAVVFFLSNHSVWREDFFFNLPLLVFFQELFHNKCIYRIHYLWFSKIQYNGIQWTRVGDFALRGVMSTSLPPLTMWNFWRHFRGNERMVFYLANGFL